VELAVDKLFGFLDFLDVLQEQHIVLVISGKGFLDLLQHKGLAETLFTGEEKSIGVGLEHFDHIVNFDFILRLRFLGVGDVGDLEHAGDDGIGGEGIRDFGLE
jgi:hypothetical protein